MLREDTKLSVELYNKQYNHYPASETRPYLIMANTGVGFGGSQNGFQSFGVDPLVSEGTGRSRGIEILLQKKQKPLYGIVSATYSQTEFTALDGKTRPGSYDQRWIFNTSAGYLYEEKWEFNAKFRFYTGRPYTPFSQNLTKSAELFNTERIDPNHALDIRIERRWYFDRLMLITYVDVQNAYNYTFNTIPRYDSFEQKVESSGGIGILPSIGIGLMF